MNGAEPARQQYVEFKKEYKVWEACYCFTSFFRIIRIIRTCRSALDTKTLQIYDALITRKFTYG